jgi:hypothetical protein
VKTPTLLVASFVVLVLSCGRAPSAGSDADSSTAASAFPSTSPPRRYGDVMTEVGRRFERIGRAVAAGRWELAGYDLDELDECFADLATAAPPPDVKTDLRPFAKAFVEAHPAALKKLAEKRDRAAFGAEFERTATTCNGCHQAAGKWYLVVPGELGASVPQLGPSPSTSASR